MDQHSKEVAKLNVVEALEHFETALAECERVTRATTDQIIPAQVAECLRLMRGGVVDVRKTVQAHL